MSIEMDQFHEVFFTESFEALDSMESALLNLTPGTADSETINTIFRVAHSIKGGAGMFGFNEVAAFTHTLETLLDELRAGRINVTEQICDGLLQSVDQIRAMMNAVQKHESMDMTDANTLQEIFKGIVGGGGTAQAAKTAKTAEVPPAALAAAVPEPTAVVGAEMPAPQADGAEAVGWRIRFKALPELLERGNDPLRMFDELAGFGELEVQPDVSALPSLEAIDFTRCHIVWSLVLRTARSRADVEQVFEWAEGDCELKIEPLLAEVAAQRSVPSAPPATQSEQVDATANVTSMPRRDASQKASSPGKPAAASAAQAEVSSIRVAIEKIDELLNTVGEIVITQSMLSQLATTFDGPNSERLRTGLDQLESNVRELQESVMRVRMLPVGSVFSRFPRMVRDISQRLGKQIRLKISGEQTELDKTVLERIGDPLVHLVRNSVDHGIESTQDRIEAGKPAEGTVHLDAYHKGGAINIVIRDDGKGLDRARILEKARSKGLIDQDATMSDEQIYELIFLPGFSTAAATTDLSGRGVGMDVVRRNIKELGGNVELRSELGKGTTVTITLPLTLAIVDGQKVQVGSETYIVPLVTIMESLQVRRGSVRVVPGQGELFSFRGDYLPVIRLHEVFGVEPRSTDIEQGLIMVVEGDGRRAGLLIDELLGQQQVVIKSMETNYTRIEGIGGATILGEGAVALILDVPGLLRMAQPVQPMLRTGT